MTQKQLNSEKKEKEERKRGKKKKIKRKLIKIAIGTLNIPVIQNKYSNRKQGFNFIRKLQILVKIWKGLQFIVQSQSFDIFVLGYGMNQ